MIRRALGEYLPPSVAARTSLADKAEFSSTYVEALEALGGARGVRAVAGRRMPAGSTAAFVRRMYDEMIQLYRRGDDAYIAFAGPIWSVVALELWLDAADVPSVDTKQGAPFDR